MLPHVKRRALRHKIGDERRRLFGPGRDPDPRDVMDSIEPYLERTR